MNFIDIEKNKFDRMKRMEFMWNDEKVPDPSNIDKLIYCFWKSLRNRWRKSMTNYVSETVKGVSTKNGF